MTTMARTVHCMKGPALTLFLACLAAAALAVPAKRGFWREITLADGTVLVAELRGDESARFYRSLDGRLFVSGPDDTLFHEAPPDTLASRAMARRRASGGSGYVREFLGERRGLIILVEFQDCAFSEGHTQDLYYMVANGEGFTSDDGFRGSVRDYFLDQSYGLFTIDFDVAGPVALPEGYAYYGENDPSGDEYPERLVEFVTQACRAVDGDVDFSLYDWDGDGEVDQVFLLYAGKGEADSYVRDTIWPHEWDLRSAGGSLTLDGVAINTYACANEVDRQGMIEGIGTICHEFSHCLGLPDMYDTNYDYFGMDCWDLMDYGNYNGDGFVPAGFTAFERMSCGWLEPTVLDAEAVDVDGMRALAEEGEAYVILNDAWPDEFYVLENRQRTGWDEGLPASGMLIVHVDYDERAWDLNVVNNSSTQRCTIFPADGRLTTGSVSGDPYPYGGNDSLTDDSTPAATLNNENLDGTLYMHKGVTGITRNQDGTMSFSYSPTEWASVGGVGVDGNSAPGARWAYGIDGKRLAGGPGLPGRGVRIVGGRKVLK